MSSYATRRSPVKNKISPIARAAIPLPIWVKPNIVLSNQTGRDPRRLKNRKAQTSTRWPTDHTSETASKLKTSSILDRIPRATRPCQINHPHLGRHPCQEQNQAGCEEHQPGNRAILSYRKDQASPGTGNYLFRQSLSVVWIHRLAHQGSVLDRQHRWHRLTDHDRQGVPLHTDVQRPFS